VKKINDKINPFAIRLLDKAFQVAKTVQNPDVKFRTLTEIAHRFDLVIWYQRCHIAALGTRRPNAARPGPRAA
jgi:hypothetical protein